MPDTATESAFCEKLTSRESLVNLCSTQNTVISKRSSVGSSQGGSVRLLALTHRWTKVLLCTHLFKVFSLNRWILEQLYLGIKQWENSILSFSYSFVENSFYYWLVVSAGFCHSRSMLYMSASHSVLCSGTLGCQNSLYKIFFCLTSGAVQPMRDKAMHLETGR